MLYRFMKQFLNSADNAKDPLCSPILRESFTGLPPALFIVSEIDPLADQSSGILFYIHFILIKCHNYNNLANFYFLLHT